jgi:hypothetical protein
VTRSRIDGAIGSGAGGGGGAPGPQGPPGPAGPAGADGTDGTNGVGVPVGGGVGQVLAKNTATDFDTGWTTPAAGGAGVPPETWDANSLVKADVDDTPIALPVGPSTVVGRAAAGPIAALTPAQVKTLLALVAADISDFDTRVRTNRLDQMAAPTGPVSFAGHEVTNVLAPTNPTDAATKAYVDGAGLSPTVLDANTVLKADVDNTPVALPVPASTFVGRAAAGNIAALTTAQAKTLLAIVAADISDFNTQVRTNRLDQMATPTGAVSFGGQDITNANWAGTTIPVTAGGTGSVTAAAARSALGTMGKYNGTVGDGTTTSFTVTHGLNRTAVAVELYDATTLETILARVTRLSTTQMRLDFNPAPAANAVGIIAWA